MSTEIKKLNDNALNKWKAELYYCSKNFKKDKAYFNLDCLKNALYKVIELMHLDGDSVDSLLGELCSDPSLDSQRLLLDNYKSHSVLTLFNGGVLDVYADAIVNAANCALAGGGGVDGAIHKAAGIELNEACMKLHGCRTGDAKVTSAFNIKSANYIIHTVGPVYQHCADDPLLLVSCYKRSLDEALKLNLTSIGFCGISTGVYGYPLLEACTIARDSIKEWINTHPNITMNIYLCCFSKKEIDAYKQVLSQKKSYGIKTNCEFRDRFINLKQTSVFTFVFKAKVLKKANNVSCQP